MATIVTRSGLQKAIGCSMRTIRLAILSGRIKGDKDGNGHWQFDLETCREALRATSTAHRLPGAKELGDNEDGGSGEVGDSAKPGSIAEARLQFETYRAKSEELDYRKKAGELISTEDVRREFEDIAIRVQKGILAVVPRVSPIVAAETDEFKVSQLLTLELKAALRSISDGLKLLST
jgi:phage terminase Nu1 subunit (DNA packaging protein)